MSPCSAFVHISTDCSTAESARIPWTGPCPAAGPGLRSRRHGTNNMLTTKEIVGSTSQKSRPSQAPPPLYGSPHPSREARAQSRGARGAVRRRRAAGLVEGADHPECRPLIVSRGSLPRSRRDWRRVARRRVHHKRPHAARMQGIAGKLASVWTLLDVFGRGDGARGGTIFRL